LLNQEKSMGKILLMNDDRLVRDTLGKMFEFLGYSIVRAKNGEEALAQYRKGEAEGAPVSTAILDLAVDMESASRDAAIELRKLKADLPILAIRRNEEDPALYLPSNTPFSDAISISGLISMVVAKLERHLVLDGQALAKQ
jgi:CheY-like chemotaxis protein